MGGECDRGSTVQCEKGMEREILNVRTILKPVHKSRYLATYPKISKQVPTPTDFTSNMHSIPNLIYK